MALFGKLIGAVCTVAKKFLSATKRGPEKDTPKSISPEIPSPPGLLCKKKETNARQTGKHPILESKINLQALEKSAVADFKTIRLIDENGVKKIEADGIVYSLFQFSKKFGINFSTLYGRIQKGYRIEEVIRKTKKVNRDYKKSAPVKAKLWEWNGEKHTIEEWAEQYGVKKAMMRIRLMRYGSPERNTSRLEAYKARRQKILTWNGESHTIKEWAAIYKVPERTMYGRWQAHNSPEHIANPFIPEKGKLWEYNGENHTVAEWAKIVGRCERTVRHNLKTTGIPYTTYKKHPETISADGGRAPQISGTESDDELFGCDDEWKTAREWAKDFGISEKEIRENFAIYGTPIEPAFTIEENSTDDTETEEDVDKILDEIDKPNGSNPSKQETIDEWCNRIRNLPDDDRTLRESLVIPEDYIEMVRPRKKRRLDTQSDFVV